MIATMTIDCDKTLGSALQFSCRELDEDTGFTSSKVLLTAPFSEIRTESGSFVHSVQLVLTIDCEILVLKRPTDKCGRYSFLRRHKLSQTEFTMNVFVANSFTAIVPDTILRYSYQLYGTAKSTIGEWLLKIAKSKMGKKAPQEKNLSSPDRESSTAGQPTNYQATNEPLHAYSSPTHPVQRQLQVPSQPPTSQATTHHQVLHPLMNGHTRQNIVQMPNGLIKARSFQERGSVRHHFVRNNASTSDLRTTPEDLLQGDVASSTPSTPSPVEDDGNPFESRLRHTQVRNKKRMISPRVNRSNSTQPNVLAEDLSERDYYGSRSANSTPVPGLSSSIVIASPAALTSEMAGPSLTKGSTLPRTKKGKRYTSVSDSSTSTGPSPSKVPGKSPKLLRMLHRRWQSSSAIKVPLNLDVDEQPSTSTEATKKLHQYSPKEVAEELSLMDAELLRRIGPQELENGAWMKKESKDKLAPNILAMVRSFNQLALLIPSEILEEKTTQGRAKIMTTYIQIASKLYTSSHNYNSLKAVLAGLQSTPIYRLKKTWKEVPSKKRKRFEQLCALMSECENWQLYRSEIDRKLSSGSSFIPFLGQFLTQVVQTDSYNQAREDRKASVSPTETPSKTLTVPESRQRMRSSSLDDAVIHSTSTQEPSSEEPAPSLMVEDTLSASAPVSPVRVTCKASLKKKDSDASSQSTDSEKEHSKSLSFDSSCLSPPPSTGLSDEDEVDGDNGSQTTDSGHHSSSGIEFRVSPSLPKSSSHGTLCVGTSKDSPVRRSQLELSQIYVSLQRHSQSYETLLNTYTKEDPNLREVLHSTLNELSRLSVSLQSLDSVFSDDEEDSDPMSQSLNVTGPLNYDSDPEHTSDYGSDVNATPAESPKIESEKPRKPKRILFHAKSEPTETCPLSPEHDQYTVEDDNVTSKTTSKKSKKVGRSKSCSNGSKGPKRRYRNKSHKSDEVKIEPPKTSAGMLNTFQVASLGCSMGVKGNSALRSAICDVEPLSESLSYKLSVEREAHKIH